MVLQKSNYDAVEAAAKIILNEGIVILPTDTVYGFSGLVPVSKNKIMNLKKRESSKDFIRLIAEPSCIFRYTDSIIPQHILNLWPCPLTLIVNLRGEEGTCAFRCPDDKWLRSLIKKAGGQIYSTSVNYSGEPVFTDIKEIISEFESKVDLIIDGGDLKGEASTILDITCTEPKILRTGAVSQISLSLFKAAK